MTSNTPLTMTRHIPLIAIFSALYAILRFIPFIPWIGGPGFFTLADFIVPFLAILFGPYVGGSIVVLGTVLGFLSGRMPFFGLDFLPALTNVLIIGFLLRRKWILPLTLLTSLIVLFFLHPYTLKYVEVGGRPIPFIWMHLAAYLLVITPIAFRSAGWINDAFQEAPRQAEWWRQWLLILTPTLLGFAVFGYLSPLKTPLLSLGIESGLWAFLLSGLVGALLLGGLGTSFTVIAKRSSLMAYTASALVILSFIGSLTQHLTGNILFATISITLWGMTPTALMDSWKAIFIVYPFERIIIVLISTLFCLFLIPPLIKSRITRFLTVLR